MAIFFGDFRRGRGRGSRARHEWAGDGPIHSWPDDGLIAELVHHEQRGRSLRAEIFDANVVGDSSWPLVQDLFAAHLAGARMRTKELCATSGLPQTTVLRYLDHLERFDVIRRDDDPEDQRVTLVSITEAGAFWMREYYTQMILAEQRLRKNGKGLFALPDPDESDTQILRDT
jgi:hypothetical protein